MDERATFLDRSQCRMGHLFKFVENLQPVGVCEPGPPHPRVQHEPRLQLPHDPGRPQLLHHGRAIPAAGAQPVGQPADDQVNI